ncbi:hypothetical protein SKAU_G00207700 [Synaphobranchus kaupii]|uniref:Reverse transcriptase n=1 Tax=Synaphobranchus kaupii TaxID=118154 RepID=A0A9Q1F8Q6_SYNKA|nr:hypothetical protein SKAU_G00207700 [Synaphobranchus kaupii]
MKQRSREGWMNLSELMLKALRGPVEAKLNLFGEILYEECSGRRQLRRRWRKAEEQEKEGLKALWDEIRGRLANLRRAERIRRQRKRKEKERAYILYFFMNPFQFACGLLEEQLLMISKEDLEEHIHVQYSDSARTNPLGPPGYMPKPTEPSALFDTSPPKLSEIRQVIQRSRSASAPGPNGIPYELYKNCPRVLKLLWTLMRTAWTKLIIPSEWRRAVEVFIPKDHWPIQEHRMEGKIFFSVMKNDDHLLDGKRLH